MARNLKIFETLSDYQQAELVRPAVSLIEADGGVHFDKAIPPTPPTHDYSLDYLTFRALEDGTFTFNSMNTISYSLDSGTTWTELAGYTASPTVTSGNTILWKCLNPTIGSKTGIGTFQSTGLFDVEGNAMSLHYGDNFVGQTDLTGKDKAFFMLFLGNTNVVNAENLILPATTLTNNCYSLMFSGCANLETAPKLPAASVPYQGYSGMFYGCSKLSAVTCLATSIDESYGTLGTSGWLNGVAASGTFTKAASMNDWTSGVDGIPTGWTVQDAS